MDSLNERELAEIVSQLEEEHQENPEGKASKKSKKSKSSKSSKEKEDLQEDKKDEDHDTTNVDSSLVNDAPNPDESKTEEKGKQGKKKKDKKKKQATPSEVQEAKEEEGEPSNEETKKVKKKKKKDNKKDKEEKGDKKEDKGKETKRARSGSKENPQGAKQKKRKKSVSLEKNNGKEKSQVPPSKKTKASKVKVIDDSFGDPKEEVFNYLLSQNRPYSTINIFDNLHGKIKKGQLQKILDNLTLEGKIICKEYNTKIYLVNQNNFPPVSEEELKEVEDEITEKRKVLAELRETLQNKEKEYKKITSVYTDEELELHLKEAKKELECLESKVQRIENNTIELIPEEKMLEAEKRFEQGKAKYRKIKRICMDILDQFSEGLEMKTSKLMDDIGIENDTELIKTFGLVLTK